MKSKTRVFTVFLLLVIGGNAVWFYFGGRLFRGEIRNVVLISIDTCRPDYLSCYGYKRKTTPNIDAVAKKGVLFENVVSPIPLTLPAHCSMLTGTDPPYHGVHDNVDYRLSSSNLTLAEILRDHGFATGAIVSSFVLDSQFGTDQGFDYYNDKFDEGLKTTFYAERRGREASKYACNWLGENKDKPFFLFLHYYDPHLAYDPPQPYRSRYADNLYAGEIAYTDECIGTVIKKLKKLGLYNSTLLIITGDHGESLGEHGETGHGYFIYNSTIKVPLIFKAPGVPEGREVNGIVGLIDIVPTVLSYLGIPIPAEVQGKNLSDYFNKDNYSDKSRFLFCESLLPTNYQCNPLLAVVTDRWKYIQTTKPELYDMEKDRQELNNLIGKQPNRARIMQDRLKQILENSTYKGERESKSTLDQESIKRLESLGYVSGGDIDDSFEFDQSKNDAKDYASLHREKCFVVGYILAEEFEQAKKTCFQMISEYGNTACAYFLLGDIAYREKDFDGSAAYYSQGIKLDPKIYKAYRGLGRAFVEEGKLDEAAKSYEQAIRLKPDNRDAHYELGVIYAHQKRYDDSIKHWENALELNQDDFEVHTALADLLAYQGNLEQAVEHWGDALKVEPENVKVRTSLANAFSHMGKTDQAIGHYEEIVRLNPEQLAAQNTLAELLFVKGRIQEAIERWQCILKLQPNLPPVLNNLAWVMAAHTNKKFRNPSQALRYAQKACKLTNDEYPDFLDTLAIAYAANGKFNEAVQTAKKALGLYRNLGQEKKAKDLQSRIELFEKSRPYRDKS